MPGDPAVTTPATLPASSAPDEWEPLLRLAAHALGADALLLYLEPASPPITWGAIPGPPPAMAAWDGGAPNPSPTLPPTAWMAAGVVAAWGIHCKPDSPQPPLLVATFRHSDARRKGPDLLPAVARQVGERLELAEARDRQRQAFDEHGAAQLLVDPDALLVVDANRAAAAFYGYPRAALRGMCLTDLSCESAAEIARNAAAAAGGTQRWFRVRHRLASGEERTLDVQSGRVDTHTRPLLLSVIHDVTEEERAAEGLRTTQSRLSSLLVNLPNVAFYETGGGREFTTENIRGLVGYQAAELAADRRLFPSLIHPDDRAALDPKVRAWHEAGEPAPLITQFRVRHRDGHTVWVEDHMYEVHPSHGASYMSGVLIDVTERKAAEAALEASQQALERREAHFRTLIENALDIITVLDPNGTIVYESPSMERVLGYPPGEMLGRPVFDYIHPDDAAVMVGEGRERALEPAASGYEEFRVRHRDGHWVVVQSVAQLLETPEGPRLIVNSRDVTEHRRLEEQLRHALKMEAVGRLSAAVAHDFNNVLAVIAGYTQLLQERSPDALASQCLGEIAVASERAMRLTRKLLAFSRKQPAQMEVMDLNAVIRGMEGMLGRLAGPGCTVRLELEPAGASVRADAGQLEQVLINLVVNSRDAMPNGGSIAISTHTENEQDPEGQALGLDRAGPWVRLTVTDTGCGMEPETLAHLFEPFFTTKEPGKGTGLGLATVYGIVEQSGGRVEATSTVGEGSTFRVWLARCDEPLPETPAPLPVAGGCEVVLVAEDDDQVRRLVVGVLTARGYRVIQASGGAEALDLLRDPAQPVDLLLTDVMMPGMRGPELAAGARSISPGIRTVYMSGHPEDPAFHARARDEGAAFLPKPFTPEDLLRAIRRALGG